MDHWFLTYFFAQPNFSPCQLCWAEKLADFFPSVVFSIPWDLLTSFWIQFLTTMIFWPPWPWTLLCPTSLIRFGSSRSIVLSWGGIGIMFMINIQPTMYWKITLVISWCTREYCIYFRVLPRPYYENTTTCMIILARYKHKR